MLFARLPFSALFCPGAGYRKIRVSEGLCPAGKCGILTLPGPACISQKPVPAFFC